MLALDWFLGFISRQPGWRRRGDHQCAQYFTTIGALGAGCKQGRRELGSANLNSGFAVVVRWRLSLTEVLLGCWLLRFPAASGGD